MNDFSREVGGKNPETEPKPKVRVIYIEDNVDIKDSTLRWFRENTTNIEIISWFPDTEEAERYLKKQQEEHRELPNVIITDHNLGAGKRDGIDFAKWVKSQKDVNNIGNIPVILYSGNSDFSLLTGEELGRIGLVAFVDKGKKKAEESLIRILNNVMQ